MGWQAWRTSYRYEADRRNPYVYAQTVPDLLELVEQVSALAKVHPSGDQVLIKVMVSEGDYWPLPWYLRQFKNVGWWDHVPENPSAPIMIVGTKLYPVLQQKQNQGWSALGMHGLRPGILLQLCVDPELWRRYVETLRK